MLGQSVDEFTVFINTVKLSSNEIAISPSTHMQISVSTHPWHFLCLFQSAHLTDKLRYIRAVLIYTSLFKKEISIFPYIYLRLFISLLCIMNYLLMLFADFLLVLLFAHWFVGTLCIQVSVSCCPQDAPVSVTTNEWGVGLKSSHCKELDRTGNEYRTMLRSKIAS